MNPSPLANPSALAHARPGIAEVPGAPDVADALQGASAVRGFCAGLGVELRQTWRTPGDLAEPLVFFAIVASLYPLAVGAAPDRLAALGPGVIWISGLFAVLLSLPRLYARDAVCGTLEQMLLSPYPLAALVAAKMFAHWLLTGLPLALLAPFIGLAFGIEPGGLLLLAATVLLGMPILTMIGGVGAALALGARGGAVLLALLVLPLYVPVLVFATGAVEAWRGGVDFAAGLYLLGALLLAALVLAPWAAAAALRITLD